MKKFIFLTGFAFSLPLNIFSLQAVKNNLEQVQQLIEGEIVKGFTQPLVPIYQESGIIKTKSKK